MPNTNGKGGVYLTNDEIAREALRRLENALVATRLVNRDQESHFNQSYKKGDVISVKKPVRVKSAEGATLVKQPIAEQVVPFTINRHRHVGLEFTARDRMLNINEFSDKFLKAPAAILAHDIDRSILQCAVDTSFNVSGTPGQNTSYETIARAAAAASMLGHPNDSLTSICLNPLDAAEYRIKLTTVHNDELVKSNIERARLGNASGMNMFETAQMPMHTVGVATGSPKVNAASQTGSTLVTKGWTNSTSKILKKGDVIEIAGVYSVNPMTYESTGMLQRFVITADADSGASTGPATLSISPAINDGTLTALDGDGNTVSLAAYQNVTAAPEADADITVIGTGGSVRRENVMLHKDAITLAVVDPFTPQTAPFARTVRSKNGMALSMTGQYDITNYKETFRIDVLWGVHNLYPDLTWRLYGTAAA